MNLTKLIKSSAFLAVGVSALCFYFGNGMTGDFWFLLWLAPAPVIVLSVMSSRNITFIASFAAYLLGRLGWFSYLEELATTIPAIIYTILPALIFAGIILLSRAIALKRNAWAGLFAFPVFFTAFEFLMFRFSPDGTALSIAYSQMDFLPLIQIASLTGIIGITFMVTFIPSAIAYCYLYRKEKVVWKKLSITSIILISGVLVFGTLRLYLTSAAESIKVGLVVMPEAKHNNTAKPDLIGDKAVMNEYVKKVIMLAQKGAHAILLPERALSIDNSSAAEMLHTLQQAAAENHIHLILGYTNLKEPTTKRNSALVIDPNGKIITDYNKAFLVTGLERDFVPGEGLGVFRFEGIASGVAICKDLDFEKYIRTYSQTPLNVLFVPAWDFVVDDWLHSRMAILRSVENGFSQVRAAREGRLTISDMYGRVSSEASSANHNQISLIGDVSTKRGHTFFTAAGNWFGVIIILLATTLIGYLVIKRKEHIVLTEARSKGSTGSPAI